MKSKISIYITGSSGFIGKNLFKHFEKIYTFSNFEKGGSVNINQDVVIHLAGKAHDLENISDPLDYYISNTELTKKIVDAFLVSNAKIFITLSSVKAVADSLSNELTEQTIPNPTTHYGKSKLLAEEYILKKDIPIGKRIFILRPCMIHGPGNKGNLNLLYKIVSKGLPWPLGSFDNSRSYLSIENLCFIIKELIERNDISSGIYNVADDIPLSTNEVISLIAQSNGKQACILKVSTTLINFLVRLGDFLKLPINSERLKKLTESYVVSNLKIKSALGKPLPVSSKEGLIKTFQSFSNNV